MSIFRSTLLTAFAFTNLQILAQENIPSQTEEPYIEVTGHAEKEVIPDEIFISISIYERKDGRDNITVEEQEVQLKNSLQKVGISLDNLFLSDVHANYVLVRWFKKDVMSNAQYTLMVKNANEVKQVFEQLDSLEIQNAYISKADHSKLDSLKKEVKIEAMKKAKDKAEYLLAAVGEKTGKPMIIKETKLHAPQNARDKNYELKKEQEVLLQMHSEEKRKGIIQFKKIKLEACIYAEFRIE